jgi:hypothetical protein
MNYAVLDVETTMIADGELPRTLFWGLADETSYYKFNTTKALLKFLKTYESHTILHHSNFDVLQLLLDGAPLDIQRTHNARIIRCKLFNHSLLNSYSAFPLSLAAVFDCFGYSKSPLTCPTHEHDKESQYDTCAPCRHALHKRNFEDCKDGLDSFLRLDEIFSRLVGQSPLERGTIAGTAFRSAQECAGYKLPVDTRYLEAYRGGRVEVFNTNDTVAEKFDINSSYPFAFIDAPDNDSLLAVTVKTNDHYCPLFDASVDDCLLFPNGRFVSWVFESNLQRYLEPVWTKTTIKVIKRIKIDLRWIKAVVPLIEKLYRKKNDAKQKGDKAIETASKLLLNSLYGRIGLKGESERCRVMDYRPDREDCTTFQLSRSRYLVFDSIFREVKSNFPLAAFITDNGRARLYRGLVGARAYYGDTDSVISPTAGKFFNAYEKCGSAIGEWKYEGKEKFKAQNVKDYFWGSEEVRKGGAGFIQWTLKTMAAGNSPRQIVRERISELRKRVTTFNGETLPVVVNK